MSAQTVRPGDLLAGRYLLVDLLSESSSGRFWRAHDRILERHVAVHVIPTDDPRADALLDAARRSAEVTDRRLLRVLDAVRGPEVCYVVNEWGQGTSLDFLVATSGPMSPRTASWLVGEVAETVAHAHARLVAHGRLIPENVMVDTAGEIRLVGCCVDAALHGLPPDRYDDDVVDLGGLLHTCLTGRWAGVGDSSVPRAPSAHGRVLRPRQVRAGVPRQLDDLCDDVLAGWSARGRHLRDAAPPTAQSVGAALRAFNGDPAGIGETLARRIDATHPGRHETVVLPAVPEFAVREPEPVVPPSPAPPSDEPTEPDPVDIPTEVGMPVFGEGHDDVSWFSPRPGPVKPPPPFEAPPDRPLFAPEPDDGSPVRKVRPGVAPPDRKEYWPWDGTGTGPIAKRHPPAAPVDDEAVPGRVPGRRMLRLAAIVGVVGFVLVAAVVVFNLGRGRTVLGADKDPAPRQRTTPTTVVSTTPTPPPVALTGLTAVDFDPLGEDREENPDLAALAVDGDPTTAWHTDTYRQQFGPGGLKSGVGLVIDLGAPVGVREVDLTLGGTTGVSLYLTEAAPTGLDGLTPVDQRTAGPTSDVTLATPTTGRYLTVWLTSLPDVGDGFQGQVAEVRVLS